MDEIAVITMGKTPAIATQFVDYIINVRDRPVKNVYLISTLDPLVYGGSILAKMAIEERFNGIYIDILKTEVDDLDSPANVDLYINSLMRELRDRVLSSELYTRLIHLCIAGGRKNMTIISTIFSLIMRPVILYHIINRKHDVHKNRLEGLEDFLLELSKTSEEDEIKAIYRELKNSPNVFGEYVDEILYPSRTEYEVLEMYVPPYPNDYMNFIKFIIRYKNGVSISKIENIFRNADAYIKPLINAGLLEYKGSGIIRPSKNLLRFTPFFE